MISIGQRHTKHEYTSEKRCTEEALENPLTLVSFTWMVISIHKNKEKKEEIKKTKQKKNRYWVFTSYCISLATSAPPSHVLFLFFIWSIFLVISYHPNQFDLFIHWKNKWINQLLSIGLLAPHLKEKRTRMEEGRRRERGRYTAGKLYTRLHGVAFVPWRKCVIPLKLD